MPSPRRGNVSGENKTSETIDTDINAAKKKMYYHIFHTYLNFSIIKKKKV